MFEARGIWREKGNGRGWEVEGRRRVMVEAWVKGSE